MPLTISGFEVELADRVRETTQTTGTGTYSLDGAPPGFRTFVAGIGGGNRTVYTRAQGSNFEIGIGTVTAGAPATLSRDAILVSTNSNNAVSWPPGVGDIFCDIPAAVLLSFAQTADLGTAAARNVGVASGSEIADRTAADARYAQLAAANTFTAAITINAALTGALTADGIVGLLRNSNASFATSVLRLNATRTASTAYQFLRCLSGEGGTNDVEFILRGDGVAFADATWEVGGAGHAEMLEWEDGNPGAEDRVGITVTPIGRGSLIRPARDGEEPIGVVTGIAAFVSGSAPLKWQGKYERDAFGRKKIARNGARIIAKAFDATREYVGRRDRPEWAAVSLNGAEFVRPGQPVGARWRKLAGGNPERWLII